MYGGITYTVVMAKVARKATISARERRTERMELRVPPAAKMIIRHAMALTGRSAADLAYEGAKRILEEHERMVLTGANREAFLSAVRKPPRPSTRLIHALRRHAELRR